ncbi:MAG TPA: TIGR04282 family arsenosugar biosynthesis glycosyltransferase [Burkholderiales bacterium]|nr:TIGR04282 family arsenosugar biosynthesis glycosyltransferase [Burkholderiales bacterium]
METRVQVFAKAPIPGLVKTRLAARIGVAAAARLQELLITRAVETARACALGRVELWCAPDPNHVFFRDCARRYGIALAAQGEGDLGARMQRALAAAYAAGAYAVLIGSDCPALAPADLAGAADRLHAGCDVVLVPAEDGGYVLIAARRTTPELFEGVEWGTASVMTQTRSRLVSLGWRWEELPVRWDVDRPEDLERLRAEGLLASKRAV